MLIRVAERTDIPQIQLVRHSVKENILSNPALVTDAHCEEYLTLRGKGWVCEKAGTIVGFAIADLMDNNIWALFVRPESENLGIGKYLQDIMLDWYFDQGKTWVWLSTQPNSRAAGFYKKTGWQENGLQSNGEIRFQLTLEEWEKIKGKPR